MTKRMKLLLIVLSAMALLVGSTMVVAAAESQDEVEPLVPPSEIEYDEKECPVPGTQKIAVARASLYAHWEAGIPVYAAASCFERVMYQPAYDYLWVQALLYRDDDLIDVNAAECYHCGVSPLGVCADAFNAQGQDSDWHAKGSHYFVYGSWNWQVDTCTPSHHIN
jgi:hypothetical protein